MNKLSKLFSSAIFVISSAVTPIPVFAESDSLTLLQNQWASLTKRKANEAALTALNTGPFNKALITWLMTQDPDRIEDLADDGVDEYPQSAQIWYLRGRIQANQAMNSIFSALSHAKKSLTSFEQAVALQPKELVYLNGLLGFYQGAPSIAGGSTEKAQQVAQQILAIAPREGYRALIALGYNKELPETQTWLNEAQTQLGELPEFSYLKGIALQRKEQYTEATHAFNHALNNSNTDEESATFKLNSLYQIGRTAVLKQAYSERAKQALEQYVGSELPSDDMPTHEWATLRLAQVVALNNDKAHAKQLIAGIGATEDERLAKEIKAFKKSL